MRPRASLSCCSFLTLVLLAGACTEPNPDYEPLLDGGGICTPGERQCQGQTTLVCVPQGEEEAFVPERDCPAGSSCQEGFCVPQGEPCTNSCQNGQVCTIFVDPQSSTALATFCAAPLGSKPGGSFCTEDAECQSGYCVGRDRYRVCFQACERDRDCGLGGPAQCNTLTVTINGVKGEVKGCLAGSLGS